MDRILFFELIETYYQLKKKKTADSKTKFIKLYIQTKQAGYTGKEIKQAFQTIDELTRR